MSCFDPVESLENPEYPEINRFIPERNKYARIGGYLFNEIRLPLKKFFL